MSIEIFSKCVFTRLAFSHLAVVKYGDAPIAVIDTEHGVDTILLNNVIHDKKIKFIFILNNRNHSPLVINNRVMVISKRLSIGTLKNLILVASLFKEINGEEVLLSPNEKIFFDHWLQGVPIKTIAKNMAVTHKTANNMRNGIYRKYGFKDPFTFLLIAEISRMHKAVYPEHRKIQYG
ncbi:helix-turn-helix transcriptional regulator [Pectobacterium sp. CHL-2024]|uniref:helix-turn-helix transcriptional regulator n=1 Tax=Pectobacterium sp. CHL-2024 TaxID=3377079 RepID=UPI00380DC3AD